MSKIFEPNRCNVCKKLFCCANCRQAHVEKKHPQHSRDLKCPLCLSQKLPLQAFENAELLCHIVINHLPLACTLCGELFRKSQDLENFHKCKWSASRNRQSVPPNAPKRRLPLATPSPINRGQSFPEPHSKESSIDGVYNGIGSFTSPPELSRNTSTPMHVPFMGQRSNFQFKAPKVPNFSLKTPKTPRTSIKNRTDQHSNADQTRFESPEADSYSQASAVTSVSKGNNSDSQYVSFSLGSKSGTNGGTPLRSIISKRSSEDSVHLREFSKGNSREYSRSNSGRILEVMQEQEENCVSPSGGDSMDLTDVQGSEVSATGSEQDTRERKDSIKKVRFSDQYEARAEVTSTEGLNTSGNEEFYEAEEIVPVKTEVHPEPFADNSVVRMHEENEKNAEKENAASPENSEVFKTPNPPQSATSRVVMMVVVENGTAGTSDLTPLISSGLQRCHETLEKRASMESYYSSVSSLSAQFDNSASSSTRRSVTSLDSYVSAASMDIYSTPNAPISTPNTSGDTGKGAGSTGGLLSAMAHAMRYALRGLPGAGSSSRPVSRDTVLPNKQHGDSSRGSNHGFSSLASSFLRRPGKRSRDAQEGTPARLSEERGSPRSDVRSPAAKRPRGWHKIKGREPIARMRNNPTPPARGVSSGTQCFQQGSLSFGDTILPIPARAHQSTQTE